MSVSVPAVTSVFTNKRLLLLKGGYYLALASVTVRAMGDYIGDSDVHSAATGFAFLLLAAFWILSVARHMQWPWLSRTKTYLVLGTGIVTMLLVLPPDLDYINVLFFMLTVEAMLSLPIKESFAWLGVFSVATILTLGLEFDAGGILIFALIYIGAYFFFGSMASAVVESEKARTKTDELLAELTASEERFRYLVNGSPDPIFVFDPEYRLVDVNLKACELLGYTREELLQLRPQDIDPAFTDGGAAGLSNALRDGAESLPMQRSMLKRKDGTTIPVEITFAVIELAGVRHGLAVARDITERLEAQDSLTRQTRELAVLEERNRLAREMHDTLAQGFTGIVLQLEAAEQALEQRPELAGDHLSRAKSLARESLQEARRSVLNLIPRALEEKTLVQALEEEVRVFAAQGRESAQFHASGEALHLTSEQQLALLRICQESLTNVRRHAEASEVNVSLAFEGGAVSLSIEDDGRGLGITRGNGLGLKGMAERARLLGGSFVIEARQPRGTSVSVSLPVVEDGK